MKYAIIITKVDDQPRADLALTANGIEAHSVGLSIEPSDLDQFTDARLGSAVRAAITLFQERYEGEIRGS